MISNTVQFGYLRRLAQQLDMHLGVHRRAEILRGHEQLTMATELKDWNLWMDGVSNRLTSMAGKERADRMLAEMLRRTR